MTLPALAGSRLKRASCQSPTVSNTKPTTQRATPAKSSQPSSVRPSAAPSNGSEITQASAAWIKKTRYRLLKANPGVLRLRIA